MSMERYYGQVSVCGVCTNAKGVHMDCPQCFCRGYVARCVNCGGKGQTEAPVAGASSGSMKSTCAACAGKGIFGVARPADWKEPELEEKKILATA